MYLSQSMREFYQNSNQNNLATEAPLTPVPEYVEFCMCNTLHTTNGGRPFFGRIKNYI